MLIIDTAHPTARVVIADERKIVGLREWPNTPNIGVDLLVYIEELLQSLGKGKKDITRIAVHSGPGSYGLVRTGIVSATILAQATGAELVEVQGETEEELIKSARNASPNTGIEPKYREEAESGGA